MTLYERIFGCLLGGACGDALGAPVEFLSAHEIASAFGPRGINEFATFDGIIGAVTDDTQMTLFTVEGLIRAGVRNDIKGICHLPSVVNHAYRRWLRTQDEDFGRFRSDSGADGWLIGDRRLWARRAPGNTCLSALRADTAFGQAAVNDSKGCGTVMRDAPFGFLGLQSPSRAFRLAAETASTTHGHPSAQFSSGALAAIIAHIAQGHPLRDAAERTLPLLEAPEAREVIASLHHAMELSFAKDWRERLPELGQGWVAEEALAIAMLCAMAARTPREAIVAAVNHGGDSDSTGAIAGNIVGAARGPDALPQSWAWKVELRDTIETLARDLATLIEDGTQALQRRYPGW